MARSRYSQPEHGLRTADRLATLLAPWLQPGRTGPTYGALATGMRGLALDGRLPVGERVPSERELAAALGVSRATVTAPYDVLRAEGWLHSARGAGSRVALPASVPARPEGVPGRPDGVPGQSGGVPGRSGGVPGRSGGVPGRSDVLDLTVAALPAPALLLDAVQDAAVALRPLLSGHGLHPYGVPELREAVARHLSAGGCRPGPTRSW